MVCFGSKTGGNLDYFNFVLLAVLHLAIGTLYSPAVSSFTPTTAYDSPPSSVVVAVSVVAVSTLLVTGNRQHS